MSRARPSERSITEPRPGQYRTRLSRYFFATRPAFLSITLAGGLLGIASAHHDGFVPDAATALATLALALLLHAAANAINDCQDADNGSDADNSGRIHPFTGGSRFIQNGIVGRAQLERFARLLLLAAVLPGLWLAWASGPMLFAIGAFGVILAWGYSAPPLRLMSRGIGEVAVALAWLLVVIGADYVQRGELAMRPLQAGLSFALLVAALLLINEFPDQSADAAAGKRTLVVRLGAEEARWLYLLTVGAAYLWLILQVGRGALPQACAAAALTAAPSLHAGRMLLAHATAPQRLAPALRRSALAANGHGLLLAAALALTSARGT